MSYKTVNSLSKAHMQAAHLLKAKADAMPECGAKNFYLSLFSHYVEYGRWSDKQIRSVGKALGRNTDDL